MGGRQRGLPGAERGAAEPLGELGCGACQFGIKVAMRGAAVTGLDFSANQLAPGGANMDETGVRFPLVRASAEELPFADAA